MPSAWITAEHGKVFTDAQGEVTRGIDIVEFACGIPQLLKGDYTEQAVHRHRQLDDAPAAGGGRHHAVQLPAWCHVDVPAGASPAATFILKPSERDRRLCFMIAELLQQAGCRTACSTSCRATSGGGRAAAHPDVKARSFVGSTPIAQYIYETGARHGKRVQALGGRQEPMVMPDADIEQAVDALIGAAYGSAGERCMAISVAVLVGDAADKIMPLLAERTRTLKIKNGMELDAEMGPDRHQRGTRPHQGYIAIGARKARQLSSMAVGTRSPASRRLLLPAARCSTTSRRHAHLPGRDLRPGAGLRARAGFRRCGRSGQRHELAMASACFTSDGNVAREFARRIRWAWSASTCRSRCRWPGMALAAGSAACLRHARLRRRRRAFLLQNKECRAALAGIDRQGRRVRDADQPLRRKHICPARFVATCAHWRKV